MALANKNKVIRDITMMVRKEFIQFEPTDRIPVPSLRSRTRSGEIVNYSVGSVGYSPYYGNIQYGLFNENVGNIISSGEKTLDTLPQGVLLDIEDKVRTYCDKAMLRASNLALLSSAVDSVLGNVVHFDIYEGQPQAFVDLKKNGELENITFNTLFRGADNVMYVSGYRYYGSLQDVNAEIINYPLHELTDMGVSDIASCLPVELRKVLHNASAMERDYYDHLLELSESNQATIMLTFDSSSVRSQRLAEFLNEHGVGLIIAEIEGNDLYGWDKADAVAQKIYDSSDFLQSFGRANLLFVGDRSEELSRHLIDQTDLDVFMAKVITSLNVKMDLDIRTVVCDGTDGVSQSAALSAKTLGIPVEGLSDTVTRKTFDMDHFQPVKDAYSKIMSSPSYVKAYKDLLDVEKKSKKDLKNINQVKR